MATVPDWNLRREPQLQFFPVETQRYAIRVAPSPSPVQHTQLITVMDLVIPVRLTATTALGIQGDLEQV